MSQFELVFTLFGLLLGLAIAEVLGGFARTLKLRRKVRIGWLTPLLGSYVLLDLTTFWIAAYALRGIINVSQLVLLIVLLMVGGYYLIATLIFPEDPSEWPDFDAYYDRHNQTVIGGVLAINLALFAAATVVALHPALLAIVVHDRVGKPHYGPIVELIRGVTAVLPIPLLIALLFVKSRTANVALLVALIALWLLAAIAPLL